MKPIIDRTKTMKKTNSFLKDNSLYQLAVTVDELKYQVIDVETKEILHQLQVGRRGGEFNKRRELDKTSQFLRKISNGNAGLAVYEKDDLTIVTLGSAIKIRGNYAGLGIMGGGFVAGAITGLANLYFSYTRTKSVRLSCLFNTNYQHVEGEVPVNVFDKITTYTDDIQYINAPHLFHHKDNYIYRHYDKETHAYKLVKF